MDRRIFLTKASALLAALNLGRVALADETEKGKTEELRQNPPKTPPEVVPFVPGSWTLAILPDIQNYSTNFPGILRLQTQWIVDNKEKYNIVYVLQNGDMTNRCKDFEWKHAQQGLGILDSFVPYAIVPGNHDYEPKGSSKSRQTRISEYFPPSHFENWPTFGGTMEEGHIENNFHLFEAGNRKWIVIGLEWGPRDKTLAWLDGLLHQHADRQAIVLTHAYLYSDSTRYDWAQKGKKQSWNPHSYPTPGSVNDGEEMWQKVLKKHPNVFMVMNGHVCNDGLGFQVSKGDHGNLVNEMLVNYQVQEIGGGGWLRLLEFLPDGKTVQAKTYSPLYDRFNTSEDNQFTMEIVGPQ